MTTIVFSHGQESGPWGTKIRAMAAMAEELGCIAESIDYQGIADPTERVDKLIVEVQVTSTTHSILVGSSMGGHVATAAASHVGAAWACSYWRLPISWRVMKS